MTDPVIPLDPDHVNIDVKAAAEAGRRYAETYQSGAPYHHICIDDFLPLPVVERVRQEALSMGEKDPEHASAQEHLKTSYNPDTLPLYSRAVFNALNSQAFLAFLEEMTGIEHLIPDPYYKGAGIHLTRNGGYLGVHADFNMHKQMYLERRLNILIYLNPGWKPEYGGAFEVWTDDMKTQVAQFPPIMNRMCCFSTSSNSYHGNPEPVNHPDGDPRLSIALYYYTPTWSEDRVAHSTLFRPRPGTSDQRSGKQHRRRLAQEVLPPMLYRKLSGPLSRIGF
jgi:Rps23 Pro-64 3,4-dihydroxylase Tpa1-like proline 4-hydroxylase